MVLRREVEAEAPGRRRRLWIWYLATSIILVAALAMAMPRVGVPVLIAGLVLSPILFAARLAGKHNRARELRFHMLGELLILTPAQFQEETGQLLRGLGYEKVQRVGPAGDLGADLTCRDQKGQTVVVQCKQYAPGVRLGASAIQRFLGTMANYDGASRGIFATTAGFSKPAREFAGQHGITLMDGESLVEAIGRIRQREEAAHAGG